MARPSACDELRGLVAKRDKLLLEIDLLQRELFSKSELKNPAANQLPVAAVPINADVTNFDFSRLGSECKFDVVLMDPPWQLATSHCTRGVHISYSSLSDSQVQSVPLHLIQDCGFLFIWTINNKYLKTFELLSNWGYSFVDEIVWVKTTVNRRLAKGHGYYLQHAKESCLVGVKGNPPVSDALRESIGDLILAERRGQSQKPEEIYQMIERLIPSGRYLEIFGRRNNLRNHWVTIGNEL